MQCHSEILEGWRVENAVYISDIIATSQNSEERIWDMETGTLQQTPEIGTAVRTMSFRFDERNSGHRIGMHSFRSRFFAFVTSYSNLELVRNLFGLGSCGIARPLSGLLEYRRESPVAREETVETGCDLGGVLVIGTTLQTATSRGASLPHSSRQFYDE